MWNLRILKAEYSYTPRLTKRHLHVKSPIIGNKTVLRCVEKKNQLDATEWFTALIICSTCFGQFYSHHQEFETICVLLPSTVCDALVAGYRRSGAGQPAMRSG